MSESSENTTENTSENATELATASVSETPVVGAIETPVAAVVETPAAVEAVTPEVAPVATSALGDLKQKMELHGTVKKIELFGAFLDVGVGVDALLHVSQIIVDQPFKNVSDVLKVGDELTVYVRTVDVENSRIELSMTKPLGLDWRDIQEGMVVTGTVERIERFGVFVQIGAERPGMIHVSELASGYVNAPEDVVKVGEEITARVIKVNRKKKQIDLSKKAMEEPVPSAAEFQEDDSKIMTAMELALRNAMQGTELGGEYAATRKADKRDKNDKKSKAEKHRVEQEEIFRKTLTARVK